MADKKSPQRCQVCNTVLFEVIPFKTTQQEIIEFVENSSLPVSEKEAIVREKWMHAGLYCPHGCTTVFHEYGPPKLPEMTIAEAIAIGKEFSQENHRQFIQTHGENSRVVACVHCQKFGGTILEGKSQTAHYRNPKLRPLCDSRILSADCSDPNIQKLKSAWWYDIGDKQPECPYFAYDPLFHWTYKRVTGWSEYPESK